MRILPNMLQSLPELSEEAVEYVFAAPSQPSAPPAAHVVVAIDATADADMLQVCHHLGGGEGG